MILLLLWPKIRSSKPNSCKNWQSVMEEIERMHNHRRKHKKRPPWAAALGFKKEAMQFLTCLRNLRFDFRCLGSILAAEISSDDDDKGSSGGAVFSKWFMILQEENNSQLRKDESVAAIEEASEAPAPANALMLMRCRSALAKSWIEEREEKREIIIQVLFGQNWVKLVDCYKIDGTIDGGPIVIRFEICRTKKSKR